MPKTGFRRRLGALAGLTAMLTHAAAVSADESWQQRLKAIEADAEAA